MISQKQLLANQLNAQKSTGPRTEEGKARSRANALKHGLAGEGIALTENETWAYTARLKRWTEEIRPRGDLEGWLVGNLTRASIRVDRCVRADLADVQGSRREVLEAWDEAEQERLNATLPEETSGIRQALFPLEQFSTGCEWLALQWKLLRRRFKDEGSLSTEELGDALCLLGLSPDNTSMEASREYELAQTNECARGGAEEARRTLGELFDEQILRLETQARLVWTIEEAPPLREAIDRVAFDASPRAVLLRRYETACSNDLHRTLAHLARIRKDDVLLSQERTAVYRTTPQPAAPAPAAPAQPAPEPALRNEPISTTPANVISIPATTCVSPAVTPPASGNRRSRRKQAARRRLEALGTFEASLDA